MTAKATLAGRSALLLAWLLVSAFSPLRQDGLDVHITQVDASKFPSVTVYVSVTDSLGNPVAVSPESIVLSENGQPITPQDIRAMGEGEPVSTLLVIDVSGSMAKEGKLDAAKDAATAFVNQMRQGDRVGVVAFNTSVNVVQPLTTDAIAVTASIHRLFPTGDTALYDALYAAAGSLDNEPGRKAIIAMTDGMDNRSDHTARQVAERIGPGGLSIDTIGLGDPSKYGSSLAALDEGSLRSLADQAGGSYAAVADQNALKLVYQQRASAFHSEYALVYSSHEPLRDGLNRSLDVQLTGANAAAADRARYNPGGLVPEVSRQSTWGLFFGLGGVLVLLLIVPGILDRVTRPGEVQSSRTTSTKGKPRVRLDEKAPRIRLH